MRLAVGLLVAALVAASAGCREPDAEDRADDVDAARFAELLDDGWLDLDPEHSEPAGPAFGSDGEVRPAAGQGTRTVRADDLAGAVLAHAEEGRAAGWRPYVARCPGAADGAGEGELVVRYVRALADGALAGARVAYELHDGELWAYVDAFAPHHRVGALPPPPEVDLGALSCLGGGPGVDDLGEDVELADPLDAPGGTGGA